MNEDEKEEVGWRKEEINFEGRFREAINFQEQANPMNRSNL
jgi:hypothetical protein